MIQIYLEKPTGSTKRKIKTPVRKWQFKMSAKEDPDFIYFHRHTKSATTYRKVFSEKDLKTS